MPITESQTLRVKEMLVESLQMRMEPHEIGDDVSLFGDDGLGFDSVDAIEMVAGIEQEFGYAFKDESKAREVLGTVRKLTEFLAAEGKL